MADAIAILAYQLRYIAHVRENDQIITRAAFSNYTLVHGRPPDGLKFNEMVLTYCPHCVPAGKGMEANYRLSVAHRDEQRVGLMAVLYREFRDQGDVWLCFEDLNYATLFRLRET